MNMIRGAANERVPPACADCLTGMNPSDGAWHQEAYNMHYTLRNVCYKKHQYTSLNAFHPVKGPNPKYKPYWKIITSNWKLAGACVTVTFTHHRRTRVCARINSPH